MVGTAVVGTEVGISVGNTVGTLYVGASVNCDVGPSVVGTEVIGLTVGAVVNGAGAAAHP